MMKVNIFIAGMFFFNLGQSAEPMMGCRVKPEVLMSTFEVRNSQGNLVHNAGCIINKESVLSEPKVLMIYTDKDGGGYAFPGGKASSLENDQKEKKKNRHSNAAKLVKVAFKNNITDYQEPLACAASRETKEETGLDVIVGDVLLSQKYFVAFNCYAHKSKLKNLKAIDKNEVKGKNPFVWVSRKIFNAWKNGKKGETTQRFVYLNAAVLEEFFKNN